MDGATVFGWFKLVDASLVCSNRRRDSTWSGFDVLKMLSECYFILGGHEEVVLLFNYVHYMKIAIGRCCIMARLMLHCGQLCRI